MRDPHETWERVERFRASLEDEAWLRALNEQLATAPIPSPPREVDPSELPIVYIVGAPRSGTTLLSQVVSRFLPVGYIDNLAARFWRRPSVGIRLSRIVLGDRARDGIAFESEHGTTRGVAGPHEFGFFWRHWLRLDEQATHHLSEAAAEALDREGLRDALEREVLGSFGAPVVLKNVICGFHAAALTAVHARSLFVHIVRDRDATSRSVLASRLARYGSAEAWWSLKPSTYAEIAALPDPCAQVVRQVDDCQAELTAELARPGVRALTVGYDELCARPRQVLYEIANAIAGLGSRIEMLDGVPEAFARSEGPALPAALNEALRAALGGSATKG